MYRKSAYESLDQDLVYDDLNLTSEGIELIHDNETGNIILINNNVEHDQDSDKFISRPLCYEDYISVIANCSNALLGVSIFSMPWGYSKSGLLGGSFIILFVAYISFETTRILLETQRVLFIRTGDVKSYPEIASQVLGSGWSSVVHICTAVSCLGGCVGFLIFLGDISSQLFGVSHITVVLLAVGPLILLSLIRSFQELTIFTMFGVIAITASILAISIDGSKYISKYDIETTPLFFPLRNSLAFLGPATFCYTIHYCVLAIGAERLKKTVKKNIEIYNNNHHNDNHNNHSTTDSERSFDSEKQYPIEDEGEVMSDMVHVDINKAPDELKTVQDISKPLGIAYLLVVVLVIVHGASGFMFYRRADKVSGANGRLQPGCEERVCENILLNLTDGLMKTVVGSCLCVVIILSYVLILAPARENIEVSLLRFVGFRSKLSVTLTKNSIRASLVLLTAAIAIVAPYFGQVLGAVGGLTDALQSFCLPPLICLNMKYTGQMKLSTLRKSFYFGVIIWGLGIIIHTITVLAYRLQVLFK